MRTLIYALGGGLGHVTRGLAIARRLLPLIGGKVLLLTNSPLAGAIDGEVERIRGLALRKIPPTADKEEVRRLVRADVEEFRPQLLIVDTFPRGIGGELVGILAEKAAETTTVLIGRQLPREYVEAFDLRAFVVERYDLVIVPAERSNWADLPSAVRVEPILIRRVGETLPAEAAAQLLHLSPGETCALVVASGTPREIQEQAVLVRELAASWPSHWPPLRWAVPPDFESSSPHAVRHYPVCELFSAVCVLIGSAGYNLVHESQAASIPLFAQIQPRLYDDQSARVAEIAGLVTPFANTTDLREKLAAHFAQPSLPRKQKECRLDGALEAADSIARLLRAN